MTLREEYDDQYVIFIISAEIEIPADSWLIGNHDYMGFYRTNYDQVLWQRLVAQLRTDPKVGSHVIITISD